MSNHDDYAFPCHPSGVSEARQRAAAGIRAMLPAHPSVPGLIDDALLIVSELVTNAVRNGCTSGTLHWSVDAPFLNVAVIDDSDGWPQMTRARATDERGRGLWIASHLAERFGFEPHGDGKRVWAKLAIHPEVHALMSSTDAAAS